MQILRIVFLYALTIWIAFVAIRIELLNTAAGSILPMSDKLAQEKAQGGSGKWRATWMTETRWREWHIRDSLGNADPRSLTAEETAAMAEDIRRTNADARLRDAVLNFGWLLQYAALLIALFTGITWTIRSRRHPRNAMLFAIPTLFAAAAGALAIYRGYFTSIATGI